jgi:flagellar hook-basal body complex protein FliE
VSTGIESLAALSALDAAPIATTAPAAALGTGFAQLVERELGRLDASASAAEGAMRDLAAGKPVELHEVMISLEKARLSVQTFVQVRNKLVESYQDLMRMQM